MSCNNKLRQPLHRTISIARAGSAVLIIVLVLFGITISLYMHQALETDFGKIQQRDFERRIATYKTMLHHFVEMHGKLVGDLSREAIFTQAVMQPKVLRANLRDHMSRIRLMGKQVQLTLLDFEGASINSTLSTPAFDYRKEEWVSRMMDGEIDRYFGIHEAEGLYFLTFATPILYNNAPEGLLLTEIPAKAISTNYNWPDDIKSEQLQLFYGNDLLVSLGPNIQEGQKSIIDLPEMQLRLVGYLDSSGLLNVRDAILQNFVFMIFVLAFVAIAAIFFLSRKMFIDPIEELRGVANLIANGQFRRRDGKKRPSDIRMSNHRIEELNSLHGDIMAMAETIHQRESSLEQANELLDRRVRERTQELELAHDAALSASRAKSGFLATMSHEIRTPLNAVLGILGLLKETPLNAEQQHFIRTGRESGELLLTIINDILDFSKMEADRMKLEHIGFNLHRLLTQTIELLQHQANKKSLSLVLKLDDDLPIYVKGDPDRLRQILLNLISNAIKFTPTGGVTIKVSATPDEGDISKLCCTVEDTGVGIDKEYHDVLFDKFTMADPSHSRTHEGTGLGLAICKRLVSLMHGNIGFSSEPGVGSTFYFNIQMGLADKSECDAEPETEEPGQLPATNTRILLAEDNPANQMVVKMMLEYAGLQVDIVANGEEVVEAVRTIPYDIVLMDISMPRMDGMEATGIIRQLSGPESKIPIVAVTAHALSGDKERFLATGMNDFLTKPIDRMKVLQCIAHWTGSGDKLQQDDVSDKSTVAIDEGALLDESVLQQLARDTAPEIVPELVELYISDARKRVEIIQIALREHDLKTLEFETHTIGSSAAAHGNMRLHYLARRVERLCQDGDEKQAIADAQVLIPIAAESFSLLGKRAVACLD
ncbi:MAG: response regulator [Gammaproteobacteria bacterium]|nr:response regulator [Gammaproteobacteria bacterium]